MRKVAGTTPIKANNDNDDNKNIKNNTSVQWV